MSKYKKIFSGLGLLSISTLVGASVVACANKKPKTSDSSTEAIDQNNNQGNSTTPEQEKPEPNDQGNSSKPKEGENTPGNPAPEALIKHQKNLNLHKIQKILLLEHMIKEKQRNQMILENQKGKIKAKKKVKQISKLRNKRKTWTNT
ncbi:Vmc-like lipoprotein signal peptide domain-containing protein [Mycoplasmopsis cynos]|uniref:Vmc-like lipoprotein signal peptide domain-containing protein n=1 Tax=Mycoplasmopsis cynos TaxID=171284 RepID=UPI0024C5A0D1|nr:hypothetical protein [Mycoplasmopsis cynos]WAM07873.1 hypothetical protein ONA21_00620 [Mycoplasmopsis cynos]